MPVPRYTDLFNPVLDALKALGGSASLQEIEEEVIKNLPLPDADITTSHNERQTELQYRLAWARTYLKTFGLLDNSSRGIWVLTEKGRETKSVEPSQVEKYVRSMLKTKRASDKASGNHTATILSESLTNSEVEVALSQNWRDELLEKLFNMSPDGFERLCQRMLRESGFVEVKVTGRAGDGGIDGIGIVRLGGLLGFPVLFQCKRYRGSVSASEIRDFRGAMIGRTDRGLFLTTGTFSRSARAEATRDGAPPIDLVDGELLIDKLKELGLGVSIKMIEEISILPDFFKNI